MAWTAEDRRRYAPAVQEMVRQGMLVALGKDDRHDRPAGQGGAAAAVVDAGHAAGPLASGPRRLRLAAAAGRPGPAAAPERLEPAAALAAGWRAGAGARGLVACRRLAAGRRRQPSAAIVDTQSVRTGPQRGPRGYDANKKINGRKRVLLVDVQGDPLGVRVVPADVQDRDALRALTPDLAGHASLLTVWLGQGFAGDEPRAFLRAQRVIPEIVGTHGRKGFQVEPRRWKIEQTFGCLQRYRRLRVDDEMSNETSRHMTLLASLFMTSMRFERMLQA